MHLQIQHYEKIKSDEKTIEIRLFDKKRQSLKTGDVVEFYNREDKADILNTQVVKLHKFSTLAELCDNIDCRKCGFESDAELLEITEKFYPLEKQQEHGILAIEIERI